MMWMSSTITVGVRSSGAISFRIRWGLPSACASTAAAISSIKSPVEVSATAVLLLSLPEEQVSPDTDHDRPGQRERPDVVRQVAGRVRVQQREAHQADEDQRRV